MNRIHRRLGAALLMLGVAGFAGAEQAAAQAGLWMGSTHAKFERSSRLVGGSVTADGDFWFRVDRRGNVRGHAIVAYKPAADLTRLNDAIGLVRTAGTGAVSGLPFVGAIAGTGFATFFGVKASFDPLRDGRQGAITGTLRKNGGLSISWAGRDPGPIPVSFTIGRADGTDNGETPLTTSSFPVPDPWGGLARVKGGRAVGTLQNGPGGGDVKEVRTAYWSAQRIGR